MRGFVRLLVLTLVLLASAADVRAGSLAASGGQPSRLVIPSIGVDSPIEAVNFRERSGVLEWGTSEWAVGWNLGSAVPGQIGNLVLSGHNASRGSRIFKDLHRVAVGERVTVYVGDVAHEYVITERHILRELLTSAAQSRENAAWAGSFGDERLTLITCHPTWTNTHRLVLVAKPVSQGARPLAVPAMPVLPESPIPATWPDIFSPVSPVVAHP